VVEEVFWGVAVKTTVIIACYNGERFLHKLIYFLSHEPCKVVAVDDNSFDKTWQILSQYDFVKRLRNNTNNGFAQVNNQGGFLADTEYLLFLNQDTDPVELSLAKEIKADVESRGALAYLMPVTIIGKGEMFMVLREVEQEDRDNGLNKRYRVHSVNIPVDKLYHHNLKPLV